MNLITQDVINLRKRYKKEHKYTEIAILRSLFTVAFDNDGTLPAQFDIALSGLDAKSVYNVLTDIGLKDFGLFTGSSQSSFYVQL